MDSIRSSCVTTMLETLKWPTLTTRRHSSRLNMFYKSSHKYQQTSQEPSSEPDSTILFTLSLLLPIVTTANIISIPELEQFTY